MLYDEILITIQEIDFFCRKVNFNKNGFVEIESIWIDDYDVTELVSSSDWYDEIVDAIIEELK